MQIFIRCNYITVLLQVPMFTLHRSLSSYTRRFSVRINGGRNSCLNGGPSYAYAHAQERLQRRLGCRPLSPPAWKELDSSSCQHLPARPHAPATAEGRNGGGELAPHSLTTSWKSVSMIRALLHPYNRFRNLLRYTVRWQQTPSQDQVPSTPSSPLKQRDSLSSCRKCSGARASLLRNV